MGWHAASGPVSCGRSGHGTLYHHTAKEEAVKECASSHLIIGGSYRQLSEFGLRKSAARGAAMSWLKGDDVVRRTTGGGEKPRVEVASIAQANSKQTQAAR
jgi:hypothetical protein